MDESSSEFMNLMKGEKISENSIILETSPSQMKVEESGKKEMKLELISQHFTEGNTRFAERDNHVVNEMRLARRVRKEVERQLKKLEKTWENRELPVDKETLHSVASKDAFDLRDLNESLPSTSAKKTVNIEFRRKLHPSGISYRSWEWRSERPNGVRCSLSSYPAELGKLFSFPKLQKSGTSSVVYGLQKGNNIKKGWFRPSLPQRTNLQKMLSTELNEVPVSNEQEETNKDVGVFDLVKDILNLEIQDVRQYDPFTPKCLNAVMPPVAKMEEKSSAFGNNPQKVEFPALPSWDSEKDWTTDFQSQQLSVPLNSPTKEEDFLSLMKRWKEKRQCFLREHREESKLQSLNSHRGVQLSYSQDTDEPVRKTSTLSKKLREFSQRLKQLHSAHIRSQDSFHSRRIYTLGRTELDKYVNERPSKNKRDINTIHAPFVAITDKVVPD